MTPPLVATFTGRQILAAGPSGARTLGGIAVPWGVQGSVADGRSVVFEPGSLDAAARPVALRDHDRGRPVGAVRDASDTGAGIDATVRLSPNVPDADHLLALAADGVPLMFSVGVTPSDADYDEDGVLHVFAGSWDELSILTFGAFAGATVDRVAASAQPGGTMTDTAAPTLDLETPEDPDDDDETTEPNPDIEPDEPVEAAATVVPLRRAAARNAPARHPFADVGLRDLSRLLCAASTTGDPRLAAQVNRIITSPGARTGAIEAALIDVKLAGTPNVFPGYRPAYQAELVDIVSHGSPAIDMVRQGDLQRGDYPNVTFNYWQQAPQIGTQVSEKTAIPSGPVQIGTTSVPVTTFATGNDLSQQAIDFGSPSFVEDYIRAAGVDYAQAIDLYATTALLTAATNVATVFGDTLPKIIGKMLAGLNPANVPAGPLGMLVSWDLAVSSMAVTGDANTPVFWDGNISFGSYMPTQNAGGLSITTDPNLPARTAILMQTNAATWYDLPGAPFSLRAVNVGLLGLDVGVYGYGALGVQYPGAVVKTTVPAS